MTPRIVHKVRLLSRHDWADCNRSAKLKRECKLRNSFHANGIHNNVDLIYETRNLIFEFKKDEKVLCASWAHVVAAIHENVVLLGNFFDSELLSGVKDEIKDKFAEQMASTEG